MNLNLEKEIKSYFELNKQYESTFSKFVLFFRTFGTEGNKFIQKSNKILEEYFTELKKEPSSTTNNITFLSFYSDIRRALLNLGDIFNNINLNVTDKLNDALKKMVSNNNSAIEKLSKLSQILNDNKLKLEKYKYNYFNACKIVIEQENKIIKLKDNKKLKEEDFIKNNEILGKYVANAENLETSYKTELNKFNKLIETGEESYNKIISVFKDEYQRKLTSIYNCFDELKKGVNASNEINKELLFKIDKASKCINIERDLTLFSEHNNYYNENKKRFLQEIFLDYKLFMIDNKNKNNNSRESMNINKDFIQKYKKILNLGIKNEDIYENKEIIELKTEEEKNINEYLIDLLNNEAKIEEDKYKYMNEYINKNPENIKIIIDILYNQFQKSSFIKLSNLENLNLLSQILNSIIKIVNKTQNLYEFNYIVIFLAEKTILFNKENAYNKSYLNNILSKNEYFSEQKFWMDLITKKIQILGEVFTNIQIEKIEKERNENMKNEKVFNKVKGLFNIGKSKEDIMIENEILFGQLYEEKLPIYSVQVIDEYINHFCNFNLEQKIASKLILDLSDKYKFDDSFVTYFMAKLNSNKCLTEDNSQKEIKDINYDKLYFNSANNTIIKYKHIFDSKLRVIIYSLGYLELKDFPSLLALNKNCNKNLVKIIYKNILIKYHDMDIKTHLNIWKILLDYYEIKKLYNYSEIKKELGLSDITEEITKNSNVEDFQNSKDIIDLDIVRTNFNSNRNKNQLKIRNILKSIRKAKNNLKYCQGMNYIAAFLLNITNEEEEEAFYLFLSIFDCTDYGKLFIDDLAQLKKYFYVFGRLLNVLLPELDYYLKENKIDVSYFVSPWFITLFTNTFQNIKDQSNPKILLRIFDLFFFSGWKSIIKIGISLLKNYENIIMTLTFEELLQFLIGNILKSDFFQKENFDQLMRIKINFKIKSGLIADIENEYEMKKKLDKFGTNLPTNIINN